MIMIMSLSIDLTRMVTERFHWKLQL
jgi:hypothetical protein